MRIESILRRKGGTKVTLDGVEYHFMPDSEGREFADVTNERHIGIFTSIPEGYRAVNAPAKAPAVEPVSPPSPAAPVAETANEPAVEPLPANVDKLERAALADLYEKHFGRRPAPRLSPEKILQALYDGKADK